MHKRSGDHTVLSPGTNKSLWMSFNVAAILVIALLAFQFPFHHSAPERTAHHAFTDWLKEDFSATHVSNVKSTLFATSPASSNPAYVEYHVQADYKTRKSPWKRASGLVRMKANVDKPKAQVKKTTVRTHLL